MTRLRVAVDVGGTFTDICVLDEDTGVMSVAKVPSTPVLRGGSLSWASAGAA